MIKSKASRLWQQACRACDELDIALDMPVVKKKIPIVNALLGFPIHGKASVASLLTEGPREEKLPSEKKLAAKSTRSAASSVKKPGSADIKRKLPEAFGPAASAESAPG